MSKDLAVQIARRFIQNRATKAIQFSNGDYVPDFRMKDTQPEHGGSPETSRHGIGFQMGHLSAHLSGRETYGHYLLDSNSYARMFAFDIDIRDGKVNDSTGAVIGYDGNYCIPPDPFKIDPNVTNQDYDESVKIVEGVSPLELWHDRSQAEARAWYKMQMMTLVHRFTAATLKLGVPVAAAYSGNKGVHIYGFTGEMPAEEVRAAAMIVMDSLDDFEVLRGKNFYAHKNLDPRMGYKNFTVEVFPKQTSVSQTGGLGNLMRLPLGRNQKHTDPTFFLDLRAPIHEMRPHPNPVDLLVTGDPYA